MLKRYLYILLFCIMLFSTFRATGQMTMPDNVCIGQTKHYNVDPNPGSTYIWKINGVVQPGFTSNFIDHTWNTVNTYLLEVQELSAAGCLGPVRSGQVFVKLPATPVFAAVGPYCSGATIPELPATSVNGITGAWSPAINNMATTVYTFTPNAGSCAMSTTLTITINPASAEPSAELSDYNGFNISCSGGSNGYIKINPPDNLAPYTYNWSGPGGYTSAEKDISGLKAGKYILSVKNAVNCTVTTTYILTEPRRLSMSVVKSVSLDGGYNINCAGDKTGTIDVEPVNQVSSVSYLWSDGSKVQNRTGLSAGEYALIIIDLNNCHTDSTITLTEPDSLKLKFDVTQPTCPDKHDGEIRSTVKGGVPAPDYIYRWSDNSTGKNISNITVGDYTLIVNDFNGCFVRDSLTVKSLKATCLVIPNAISPNGDLINDVWNIGNIELYPRAEVKIFNNWGETVWKSEQGYPIPWDGKSNGVKLPIDSYFYIIDLHNGSKPIAGSVTIIK